MGNTRFKLAIILIVALMATALVVPTFAQSDTPSLSVSDQLSDGSVVIASVYSEGPGFVSVRGDNGRGSPSTVIGSAAVADGWNYNVWVDLNLQLASPVLFASLHEDVVDSEGNTGSFDFGSASDPIVKVDDEPLVVPFNVQIINMDDQFVADDNTVTLNYVVTDADGWLVIHSGDAATFGAVLGQTQVSAGKTRNVSVEISSDGRTPVIWPMIHVDTGEVGTYEFGTVEGADGPVVVNGQVATLPVWTAPHIRMRDQIAVHGDGIEAEGPATVVVDSVLSEGDGFVVIHQAAGDSFGGVAGFAAVPAGLTTDLEITLDQGDVTPVLWPMLHVDTGEVGTYEFGTVEGADGPVVDAAGNIVTFPIQAAPSLTMSPQELVDGSLTIASALIDAQGWVAIHSNNDGAPGPVIATYPISAGVNHNIVIPVDADAAGALVFPMLHYDTGVLGTYEFGSVEGADLPVFVGGNVVVAPLGLGADAVASANLPDCTVSAGNQAVNRRDGSSTDGAVVGSLGAGESAQVVAQDNGWWQLDDGSWVRQDVVTESSADGCAAVPGGDGSVSSGGGASEPASTPEPGS